jgi:DNA-binding response OmpR family regulator
METIMTARANPFVKKVAAESPQSKPCPIQRILVVDDEPLICRLSSELLTEAGYQVDTAEDGEIAWHSLQFKSYSLLITDNEMPHVTGIDLLIQMRAARILLPTIMVSATLPHEELRQNLWLQPIVTLSKPYQNEELLGAVRTVLRDNPFTSEPIPLGPVRQSQSLPYRSQG